MVFTVVTSVRASSVTVLGVVFGNGQGKVPNNLKGEQSRGVVSVFEVDGARSFTQSQL